MVCTTAFLHRTGGQRASIVLVYKERTNVLWQQIATQCPMRGARAQVEIGLLSADVIVEEALRLTASAVGQPDCHKQ